MCKTLTLVLTLFALLTPACSVPFYDLDAIAILGPTVAVDQATQAVARLGGVIGNGHTIVFDEQMAYCGKTATAETLAVASTMNVHLCPAYRTSSPSTQRRAVWHELGHVFGDADAAARVISVAAPVGSGSADADTATGVARSSASVRAL